MEGESAGKTDGTVSKRRKTLRISDAGGTAPAKIAMVAKTSKAEARLWKSMPNGSQRVGLAYNKGEGSS